LDGSDYFAARVMQSGKEFLLPDEVSRMNLINILN
jgi:hypothetical protein